jgi:pectinesterase
MAVSKKQAMKRSALFFSILLFGALDSFCQPPQLTVAQDGSGNFKTVQAAFDAVPKNNKKKITILIKKGVYKEKLYLDSTKRFVTLVGEDQFQTILTYDDHTGKVSPKGDTINTYTSSSFLEAADDFAARNITFQNDAGFTAGQAVAIQILGDRVKFEDCRFVGNQDILFPSRTDTRQFFLHCYIEGTTDFIFGPSTAWFEGCHIHSKKNSHVTAASTPKEKGFGYVFNNCVLTGDSTLHNVSLGRPWRPYASVTYLHCYIGQHIRPQGWSNWNTTEDSKTARYAEYKNYGPGAGTAMRLSWTKQLTEDEAKKITLKNVMGDWDPKK